MDCPICTEKFTNVRRIPLYCPACEYQACTPCWKKHIANPSNEPRCMNCSRIWSYDVIVSLFDKGFIKGDYKKQREVFLYNKELSLFPSTQQAVEEYIQIADHKRNLSTIYKTIASLVKERNAIKSEPEITDEMLKRRVIIYRELKQLRIYKASLLNHKIVKKDKIYERKCMAPDCKGFLAKWKCGLCKNKTCPHCLEIIGESHECDPGVIKTMKLLKDDTHECPKCSMGIYKIDGCNIMFCTSCHTSFNWVTGGILTGDAHNPHRAEWLRTRPAPVDIIQTCGIDQNFLMIMSGMLNRECDSMQLQRHIYGRCRDVAHVSAVDLVVPDDAVSVNLNERIKFMANDMTERVFKNRIVQNEKKNNKKNAIYDLLSIYVECQTEIMYRILFSKDLDMTESDKLEEYKSSELIKIHNLY